MLWLPTPVAHPSRVAVSDHSAMVLERVLLSESPEPVAGELAERMLADGWLVTWVRQLHGGPARSILELAEWLAANIFRVVAQLPEKGNGHWQHLSDWDGRGLAAGAMAAPRRIDPADSRHWRSTSPDYVARLTEALRDSPCAWPDDGDEEFRHYIQLDPGMAWRLPRLIVRLREGTVAAEELGQRVLRERLEAMKELAYGASHEINNPLANISGRAQMLLKREGDPHRRRMLAAIDSQALRAHEMISDLMHFARPPRLERQNLCVAALIEQIVAELESELVERRIACEIDKRGSCDMIFADSDQLHMAVKGVIQNSIEAIGVDGRIVVTIRAADARDRIELTIADTGRGIPAEIHSRMFDPFFSGREAGRGLGFGLAKAWRIVTDHGGSIELADEAGFSTAFRLCFPLVTPTV